MMTIAIISTLISSIALVAVAISLFLQSRQLRASQLQAARTTQAELIKLAVDNPKLISEALGHADPDSYVRGVFVNWAFKSLELGYSMKAFSAESVGVQASRLFDAKYPREWWMSARDIYAIEAATKRERQFLIIVNKAFDQAQRFDGPDKSAVAAG
jgi:Family of unknown function (DUF6082)